MKLITVLSLVALSAASGVFALLQADEATDESLQKQHEPPPQITTTSSTASPACSPCTFEIIVKTGSSKDAGTDAHISLTLESAAGRGRSERLEMRDLKSWGEMGPNHTYFERGSVDVFGGHGACMTTVPCKMLLVSDASGNKPGWYVDYVKVTQIDADLERLTHTFNVNQWLAVDKPPHSLDALRDDCSSNLLAMA